MFSTTNINQVDFSSAHLPHMVEAQCLRLGHKSALLHSYTPAMEAWYAFTTYHLPNSKHSLYASNTDQNDRGEKQLKFGGGGVGGGGEKGGYVAQEQEIHKWRQKWNGVFFLTNKWNA